MAKLLRLVAYLLGTLLVLIVAATLLLPVFFDPNDYKIQIADLVETKTGRSLDIEGDIGLSVFPWLAVEVGPTRLANAAGFSDRPFAQVSQVQVRIKLLPLLRKQVEMDTVILDGLELSLETNPDGVTNWSDLTAAEGEVPPAEAAEEKAADDTSAGEMALAGLAIGGVEVTGATVVWDDRSQQARYSIEGLNLRTGAIAPGVTVPVELNMQLDVSEPPVRGPLSFAASLSLSEDSQKLSIADALFTTDLSGTALPSGELKSRLSFSSLVDLAQGRLTVTNLVATLLGLTIEADIKGEQLFADAAFIAAVKINEFVPRELIQALGQPLPEVSDATVLGKADASMQLAATPDSAEVSALKLRLDDSTIDGKLSVSNFAAPAVRFDLHLDQMDLDRYLPPQSDQPVTPVTPTTAAAAGAQMIPVELLRELNVDGSMKIDQLKAYQLRSSAIEMRLIAKSGVVRVHPARARMYQGQYDGDIKLDVRGKLPKISLNENLAGVQVGPLLKDLNGKETLVGATKARATLVATGQSPEALKKSLNGQLSFAFTDGAVKGFNLAAMLRKAQAQLQGKPVPAETGPNQTDFTALTGTASVTNGVIRNRDLLAKSPLLRVQGEGDIDLPAETLDYLVTAKVVGSLEGQGGKDLADLKGVAVPVQLSGTFTEPKYKIRLEKVIKDKAEKKIKKKLDEQLEKKFGDQFKGLFK